MSRLCQLSAAASTVFVLLSAANSIITAGDHERSSVDETGGQLSSGALIDLLYGRAGNIHLKGALLVRLLLQVYQTDDLIFIKGQANRSLILTVFRIKGINRWLLADPPTSLWSWHSLLLLFPVYTDYKPEKEKDQHQSSQKTLADVLPALCYTVFAVFTVWETCLYCTGGFYHG